MTTNVPKSALVWEGASALNGEPIFAVVTGLLGTSINVKTGPMAQVWVLHQTVPPIEYLDTGADEAVCGQCPQRRSLDGGCYVNMPHGPQAVWYTYTKGDYPKLQLDWLDGLRVRFGAYGDPAAVPLAEWLPMMTRLRGWTAYTHQWKNVDADEWGWCMASVDNVDQRAEARAAGWRTFRAKAAGTHRLRGEVPCPAASEAPTHGSTTCFSCLLCDGRGRDGNRIDAVKDISLNVHGNLGNYHVGSTPLLPFMKGVGRRPRSIRKAAKGLFSLGSMKADVARLRTLPTHEPE